ncbi:MAG: gluconeogenesis factor YvcK family protein [Anaerolineae bacterium]
MISWSVASAMLTIAEAEIRSTLIFGWLEVIFGLVVGLVLIAVSIVKLARSILAPYRRLHYEAPVIDVINKHRKLQRGTKVVAIGGGTGLPSVLKGLKVFTSNITTVVTVADDGGSSGRLRRDLGVLPPGDLRNNIAALADDENLMTQLFQYRFQDGDLGGHAFGNLFISALAGVTGSLEAALIETERVLNIAGRVYPATLEDVNLSAQIRLNGTRRTVLGESKITAAGGQIEELSLVPPDVGAYQGSVQAILDADIVVIGPGSLFTSILPNLLVQGIADALRATRAYKIYVCNIATQPGETTGYTVADHVLALEKHIGRGIFQVVLANNAYPTENAGVNTRYVQPAPENHEIMQRYVVRYVDLVDTERPWRHDPRKLVESILTVSDAERLGGTTARPAAVHA